MSPTPGGTEFSIDPMTLHIAANSTLCLGLRRNNGENTMLTACARWR
jgi:hypothetical protein